MRVMGPTDADGQCLSGRKVGVLSTLARWSGCATTRRSSPPGWPRSSRTARRCGSRGS